MKHLFAAYHLAVLAKEKGFDEPCLAIYTPAYEWLTNKEPSLKGGSFVNSFKEYFNSKLKTENVAAPLYQQLVDWFREKHDIRFKIEPTINDKVEVFVYQIGWKFIGSFTDDYEALTKALEEAFKLI